MVKIVKLNKSDDIIDLWKGVKLNTMSIKPWKSREDLIDTLIDKRDLNIENRDYAIDQIKKKNYFQLINGFETLLLPSPKDKPKKFSTENFKDFEALFQFDKKLSEIVLSIISDFELRLKTSVAYNFCEHHCKSIVDTMQYTNKSKYVNLNNDKSYTFRNYQYKSICEKFDDFIFFKSGFLNDLVFYNDFINTKFYTDKSYIPPEGVCKFTKDKTVAVPMWIAIQTIDFGTLKRLCHYLQPEDMYSVLADFNLQPTDKFYFLSMLDIIQEIRNKCAHGSLINRFRTPAYVKINAAVVNKLNLTPKNTTPDSVIYFYDALKVLSVFEDLNSIKKLLKKVIYKNNKYFKKNTYDLNGRLLSRMGESNYSEWKRMLSGKYLT